MKVLFVIAFLCVVAVTVARDPWVGVYRDHRHGGIMYICNSGSNNYNGLYSQMGVHSGTTDNLGEYTGTWHSAGGRESEGTFALVQTSTGFSGFYLVGSEQRPWVGTKISARFPSESECFGEVSGGDEEIEGHWEFRQSAELQPLYIVDICVDDDDLTSAIIVKEGNFVLKADTSDEAEASGNNEKTVRADFFNTDTNSADTYIAFLRKLTNETVVVWLWETPWGSAARENIANTAPLEAFVVFNYTGRPGYEFDSNTECGDRSTGGVDTGVKDISGSSFLATNFTYILFAIFFAAVMGKLL